MNAVIGESAGALEVHEHLLGVAAADAGQAGAQDGPLGAAHGRFGHLLQRHGRDRQVAHQAGAPSEGAAGRASRATPSVSPKTSARIGASSTVGRVGPAERPVLGARTGGRTLRRVLCHRRECTRRPAPVSDGRVMLRRRSGGGR